MPDGGRELQRRLREAASEGSSLSSCASRWELAAASPPPVSDLALLRPALLLVGAFSEPPPAGRSEGGATSAAAAVGGRAPESLRDDAAGLFESLRLFERGSGGLWSPAARERDADRLLAAAQVGAARLSWRGSAAELPERGFARQSTQSATAALPSPDPAGFREEEAPRDLFSACDNATSLVQSGDGKVVAYWSLPAEVIVVWAFPPPSQHSRLPLKGHPALQTHALFEDFAVQ